MEPGDRAEEEVSQSETSPLGTWRFRLLAWCVALVAVAFAQAPGRVVTDTKLDLTVDPLGFLGRALTLWDPQGAFGQVQNQAYGYLFPMGPFFSVGHVAHVAPWVTQRLWWAMVLIVAFLGAVKLLGAMQVGAPWARVLAGLAFALSPRMLTVLGGSSIEMWPSALAPWVLVPLVIGVQRGDPRRLAALSALAVAMVGGVNAVATFAVVPLAAFWLLCAPAGPRRRALMVWWPPLVLIGTLWWILPLVLLGRYSPPFLDYIESASNTTVASTVVDALRGTTNWVPYVDPNADAGRLLISEPLLLLNTGVVVVLGIAGLARTDLPWRRFVIAGLLAGLVLVTAGHLGAVSGVGSTALHDLLDGALAPLRNTHKFDVVVRLPLVIGLCHAVTWLTSGRTVADDGRRHPDLLSIGVGLVACVGVLGATVPAWTGHVAPRGTYADVPLYWKQTADWVGKHSVGTTLLTPATSFGTYVWGRTNDEPMQPLAASPWAVRNVIPLAPGGNIEMLDTVSRAFATGRGSAGLASFLKRSDIGTVVVRHDVVRSDDVTSPEAVRATLMSTPGMQRVAFFGPTIGGGPLLPNGDGEPAFVDEGWQNRRPAVEVFAFSDVDDRRLTASRELGVTRGRSTVMGKDADDAAPTSGLILTDGNRRQEAAFARVTRNRSASLTTDEPYRADRLTHRYDEGALDAWTTTPELRGARSLEATSSQSDIGGASAPDPSAQPWAAFDGDPTTTWRPSMNDAGRLSSLTLRLDGPRAVGTASIALEMPDDETRRLTVSTDRGDQTVTVRGRAPVQVEVGRISQITLSGRSTPAQPLAVADVGLPTVRLSRPLVLPTLPEGWPSPSRILLQGADGRTSGCLEVGGAPRCSDSHALAVEDDRVLDREVTLPSATSYEGAVRAVPRGGVALDALMQQGRLVTVETSSQQTDSPTAGAVAAADGDERTGWVASTDDEDPTITVRWVKRRTVDSLRLRTSSLLAATTAESVCCGSPTAPSNERRCATVWCGSTPSHRRPWRCIFSRTSPVSRSDLTGP
jgi:arabinofuranan 3-O-arabinosyltransferase